MKKLNFLLAVALLTATFCPALTRSDPPSCKRFGICGCAAAAGNACLIALELKDDGTFRYVDNSVQGHALTINGTWKNKGSLLLLEAADGKKSFHRKWRYLSHGTCIRSRHNMNFRRICLLNPS